MNKPVKILALIAGASVLALVGCATVDNRPPEQQVSQRVGERWKALADADFNRAYGFNTPAYRALITPEMYRSRIGSAVSWTGGEAVRVECPDAKTCKAFVRVEYKLLLGARHGDTANTHVDETWLFEDGQWWVFQPIKGN